MTLQSGEGCTYVGGGTPRANVVLSVQHDGAICREGGPAKQVVGGITLNVDNLRLCYSDGFEVDDAFQSEIVATANADGSWTFYESRQSASRSLATPASEPTSAPSLTEDDGVCRVGLQLSPSDQCSYEGFSIRIREDGAAVLDGNIGGISMGNTVMNAQSISLNRFRATKSGSTWTIESLPGTSNPGSSAVTSTPEPTATPTPTPDNVFEAGETLPNSPAEFSDWRRFGGGAQAQSGSGGFVILMDNGGYGWTYDAVYTCIDPAGCRIVNGRVTSGAVRRTEPTATPTPEPTATPTATLPEPPMEVQYRRDGTTIVVSWKVSVGADYYKVYYDDFFGSGCRLSSSGTPSFCEELVDKVPGTSYTHTDPDDDDNYYWVVACNSGGCTDIDSENPATFVDTRPSSSPANQQYVRDGTRTKVSWDAVTGADYYKVYYDDFSGSSCNIRFGTPSFCELLAEKVTGTSYTHTDPDDDRNYYWVVACNSGGCTDIDSENPATFVDTRPSSSPANQQYVRDGTRTKVSWDAVTGADYYKVYYDDFFGSGCRLSSSGTPSFCEELVDKVPGTSYTHTDPDDDDNYYWVVACNSGGCTDIDSENPATFVDTRPSSSPANQQYVRDGTRTKVSWDAVTGADYYKVYYDDFSGSSCNIRFGTPSFCELLAEKVTGTSYTHTDPDDDRNYYWVVACNSGGCTDIDSSNPAEFVGSSSTPTTPTPTPEPEVADRICRVGLIVRAGESCTYPGTDEEFSVDSSGRGTFLFFSAGTGINARGTTVNGVRYNFAARKQSDGLWVIEAAG